MRGLLKRLVKREHFLVNLCLCTFLVAIAVIMFTTESALVTHSPSAAAAPIFQGSMDQPCVAINMNVYMGEEYIPEILDALDQAGVKITFFLGGSWAQRHPQLAKDLSERGHRIGNHGYSHRMHSRMDYQANVDEIAKAQDAIEKASGIQPTLFAPPSGDYNEVVVRAAKDLGLPTIMWSVDTIDWRDQDPQLLLKRVQQKIGNGGFILTHPTKATAQMLPEMLEWLGEQGYQIIPVGDMIQQTQAKK